MFKKSLILIIVTIMFLIPLDVSALNLGDLPQVEDFTVAYITEDVVTPLASSKTYKGALTIYDREIPNYDNVVIIKDGKVIQAEYGIISINSTAACDVNVEFKNAIDNGSNYVNGCYGTDAAYLGTDETGSKALMMISGVTGWVNLSDVTIYPITMIPSRISTYVVKDGHLYHQIKQSFSSEFYSALINIGVAPSFLESDIEYFSYDGHYFYKDDALWTMLDDLKIGSHGGSVNPYEPYYNYYQFVSHRTLTNVTYEEVLAYFRDSLQINHQISNYLDMDKDSADDTLNRSQFYENEDSFFQYQYQYGANALMMIGLSMNETAVGRSSLAFTRNNLFGHAAYDSDVEKNASRYFGVNSFIYSHAKYYISGSYANPFKFQFHGSYFGNKANGMNVSYASDPYWGEKAAQFYMNIDSSFGSKDYNSVALGIKTNYEDVKVYQYDSTNSQILYSTGKNPDFAFVILDAFSNAEGDWYKVQSEATLNAESKVDTMYYYDYSNYVAYIKQSDVQVLMNMDNLGQKELIKVTFDANGGMFQDDTGLITYGLEINRMPVIEEPTKENALFVSWDKEIVPVTEEVTYVAQYKDIESIEMETYPLQYFEWNDRIDIDGGVVKVNFTDGSKKELELTTSMVSNFDLKIEGEQEVIVTVGGKTTTYPITVDKELDTIRQELKDEIVLVLEEMSEIETLSDEQAERVITLKKRMDEYMVPYLTQPQLRALDKIIYKAINHRIHYVIYKNDLDASVSGLSLAIDLGNSLENKLLKDTIKLIVKGSIPKIHEKEMTTLAEGNNFKVIDTFTIKTQKNLDNFELNTPVLISIKKPEGSQSNELFTVLLYVDGEIVKCYTKQTNNYIQFMTPAIGEFMLVSRNTTNEYIIDDVVETVRVDNSDADIPALIAFGLFTAACLLGIIVLIDVLLRKRRRKKIHDQQKNSAIEDSIQQDDN